MAATQLTPDERGFELLGKLAAHWKISASNGTTLTGNDVYRRCAQQLRQRVYWIRDEHLLPLPNDKALDMLASVYLHFELCANKGRGTLETGVAAYRAAESCLRLRIDWIRKEVLQPGPLHSV